MSEHITHTPTVKRLERSSDDKWIAGVCGGLGRYFDLTPAVFRLGFVVLTLLGGAGLLVYIAAALVMPKDGEERSIAEDILLNRRDHPARLVALGLVAVAVLSLIVRADTWPTAGTAWALVIVAGIILLWTRKGRGIVTAILALIALLVVVAVAAVTAAFTLFDVSLNDGVGNHTYVPTSVSSLGHGYKVGIGKLDVDLTQLPSGTPASVEAHVGIGDLRIVVPHDTPVTVSAHVKAGSIDALGRHEDGTGARLVAGGGSVLTVVANVGAGHIEVIRAP
jgi:phage shock protein PspC (stress-responsive transcriptional regulator)/predicted membrane protein